MSDDLLELALQAHGGLERWRAIDALEARYRAGGLAPASKLRGRGLRDFDARAETRRPHMTLRSYPSPGRRGVLDGESVRIEAGDGELLEERASPLAEIHSPRRLLYWDDLDFLYFAAYAMWGYLTAPFLFAEPGFETSEVEPWTEDGERWRGLRVRYPDGIPTHSREQVFYFDERGLLRRLDYTAEVFNSRAHAAHYCYDHREMAGLIVPTRRRVHPRRRNGTPRRAITLVAIEVESVTETS